MAAKKKKKTKKRARRARVSRRATERALDKIGDAREKLAGLSPGGAAERPLEVSTAAVVELTALGLGCARCEGELALIDHAAERAGSGVLRRVSARCKACRAKREVWLRVVPPS